MSEDYIVVHKPSTVLGLNTLVNTPKNSKRKSTNRRTPARKQAEVVAHSNDVIHLAFKQFEQILDQTKQTIHQDLFDSVYANITEYFYYYLIKRNACTAANAQLTSEDDKLLFNPICHVIPTVALFTGINYSDYASLCDSLGDRLKEQFTRNIFWISEQNTQNIKTLTNSLFTQLTNILGNESNEKIISFRQFFNLINAHNQNETDSIIFVLKQFELIPRETIENFVSLISCYVEHMPIYFMIQLASQPNIIYEQLSSTSISKLCIKKIFFMSPEQYLDKFITKLFIEQSTLFKLSGEILKFLVDIYYEYNYSISNFIHAIKYCYFDHLITNNVSLLFLCSQVDNFSLYEKILEQLMHDNKLKGVFSEKPSGIQLNTCQKEWIKFNNQFVLICRFFFELIKHFPGEKEEDSLFSVNMKSFADFYVKICYYSSMSKMSPFTEMPQYLKVKNLIQIASNATIHEIVCSFLQLIAKSPMENQSKFTDDFLDEIVDFSEILEKLKQTTEFKQTEEIGINDVDENVLESVDAYQSKANKPLRRGSLKPSKKILGELNTDLVRTNSLFLAPKPLVKKLSLKKKVNNDSQINLLGNMLDWLENQLNVYFGRDYTSKDAYATNFCYSNFVKIKKRLFDVSRINIHNSLFNADEILKKNTKQAQEAAKESPKKRLRNSLALSTPIEITDDLLFPLNVIYKIYLECGHMINLYDWLLAFVERMENADIKELKESQRKLMQALFFRSITELQFMGFIKPTSRKVDHVVKLTNGSCLLSLENDN